MHKLSAMAENVLRLAILAGFSFFFYQVVNGGELLQLIHPQFTVNAKLGLWLFLLLTAAQTLRLVGTIRSGGGNCQHPFAGIFYYSFIGALAIFLLIPAKPLGAVTAGQKGMKYLGSQPALPTAVESDTTAAAAQIETAAPLAGKPPQPLLIINDSNHVRLITAIYEDMANFLNREVQLKGFVYRPDRLEPQQFMLARFEISCCAADGVPSGLIVDWPQSRDFRNDEWLEVRGQIRQGDYLGIAVPLLRAVKVEKIAPLPNPYVYTGEQIINPDHRRNEPQPE